MEPYSYKRPDGTTERVAFNLGRVFNYRVPSKTHYNRTEIDIEPELRAWVDEKLKWAHSCIWTSLWDEKQITFYDMGQALEFKMSHFWERVAHLNQS